MRRSGALSVVCLLSALGCRSENVVRIFDGREVEGRWVSPEAYAAFTTAALEEARGNRKAAVEAYERAVAEDPHNSLAWGRLGSIHCTTSPSASDAAFARALALEPELQSVWVARAACALERNDVTHAAFFAKNAAALAPEDDEATHLVALALERGGDRRGAERWRRGLSLGSWVENGSAERSPEPAASQALDRALDHGDTDEIERAAVRARVQSSDLALRAVAHGRLDVAAQVANEVLEADPNSNDARIAALACADLVTNEDSFERLLSDVRNGGSLPSPLGAHVLEGLIQRRLGRQAAQAFRAAYGSAAH